MPPVQRRVGAYAKLLANYASDDALIEAGEAAELLFVRGLAFLATSDSDGYITDSQVVRYVGAGMKDAAKRAERLAAVGVWKRVDGGYLTRSWTKIHETAEEKGRKLKEDRERKKQKREQSEQSPGGFQTEASPDSLSLIHDRTTTRQEQQQGQEQGSAANPSDESDDPSSPFCPPHQPNGPDGQPCTRCADRAKALRHRTARAPAERAERLALIQAAIDGCNRCNDQGYVEGAAGELIGKCGHSAPVAALVVVSSGEAS